MYICLVEKHFLLVLILANSRRVVRSEKGRVVAAVSDFEVDRSGSFLPPTDFLCEIWCGCEDLLLKIALKEAVMHKPSVVQS